MNAYAQLEQSVTGFMRLSVALALVGVAWCLTKAAEGLAWASGKVWVAGMWVARE